MWTEQFEDTKGVIRSRQSKQDRQFNGQMKKNNNKTNYNLQNTTQKIKNRATRTPLKPEVNSGALEGLAVPALLVALIVLHLSQRR